MAVTQSTAPSKNIAASNSPAHVGPATAQHSIAGGASVAPSRSQTASTAAVPPATGLFASASTPSRNASGLSVSASALPPLAGAQDVPAAPTILPTSATEKNDNPIFAAPVGGFTFGNLAKPPAGSRGPPWTPFTFGGEQKAGLPEAPPARSTDTASPATPAATGFNFGSADQIPRSFQSFHSPAAVSTIPASGFNFGSLRIPPGGASSLPVSAAFSPTTLPTKTQLEGTSPVTSLTSSTYVERLTARQTSAASGSTKSALVGPSYRADDVLADDVLACKTKLAFGKARSASADACPAGKKPESKGSI